MLGFLSFSITLAVLALCSVLIVKTLRASGDKIMRAIAGIQPAADPVPLRRRPLRVIKSAPCHRHPLRAAA
jgi:hypothetical protein